MDSKPLIKLRRATIEDVSLLEYWDQQAHVVAADPNDDWDWANDLHCDYTWREQLIAEVDDLPIGFIQIIDPAEEITHYWGEIGSNKRAIDIWIGEAKNMNKGYGTQMMKVALERCFATESVNEVIIDPLASNHSAIRFYKRLGFKFVEKRIFGQDQSAVYRLKRSDWFK